MGEARGAPDAAATDPPTRMGVRMGVLIGVAKDHFSPSAERISAGR